MCTHMLSCMHTKTRGCAHVCAHVGARSNASTHGCTRVGAHTCLHTRFFGCTHTHDHTAAPWQVARGGQGGCAWCTRGPGAGGTCTNVTARGTCTEATLVHGGSESRGNHSPRAPGDAEQPPPAHSHAGPGATSPPRPRSRPQARRQDAPVSF